MTVISSSLLRTPHGFATRMGGISTLPHLSSLNLGYDVGDDNETVNQNRARFFTAALDTPIAASDVISARQIHSASVAYVTASDLLRDEICLDGLVTDQRQLPLFVKTADCCPLLFHDPQNGVIAATHAGWRGTVLKIAVETVRVMCEHGARLPEIRCAIGPCIHHCCYEVGEDFVSAVREALPESLASLTLTRVDGRFHADLPALNRALLLRCGLDPEHVEILPHCTCCHPKTFFSHRASHGKRGLGGGVIMLK